MIYFYGRIYANMPAKELDSTNDEVYYRFKPLKAKDRNIDMMNLTAHNVYGFFGYYYYYFR